MRSYKKWVVVTLLLLSAALASYSVGYAITSYYKQIVGIGNTIFTNEVIVKDIKIAGQDKVKVVVESTVLTEANFVYRVTLYLDFVDVVPSQDISFAAGEIPGTKKTKTFAGLALGPVTDIGAEVTRP